MNTIQAERIMPISREETERLAGTEYAPITQLLRSLSPSDWGRPTDCSEWDVRALAGHVVGAMSDFTALRAVGRRHLGTLKAAKASGNPYLDEYTAAQVKAMSGLSQNELLSRAERDGPAAARWRAHLPLLIRKFTQQQEVGGRLETWTMGYLVDTILTRDTWMHRVVLSRATDREFELTPEHDGRIVADVVAEWARRHGQPFTLTLTGLAGGSFAAGEDGEHLTMDAIEFCRALSGRGRMPGLLAQEVPF